MMPLLMPLPARMDARNAVLVFRCRMPRGGSATKPKVYSVASNTGTPSMTIAAAER
jgi:hypothetical protein